MEEPKEIRADKIEIDISPHSLEEEFEFVWALLENVPFYKQMGYFEKRLLNFPQHVYFEELIKIAPNFSKENKIEAFEIFKSKIFPSSKNLYEYGQKEYQNIIPVLRKVLERFVDFHNKWGFKVFQKYSIRLTLYGMGGRYSENEGKVTVIIRPEEITKLKRPRYEITTHEMVHLGIEQIIVKKYGLSHWEKETTLDYICSKWMNDLLPGYKLQESIIQSMYNYLDADSNLDLIEKVVKYLKIKKQ